MNENELKKAKRINRILICVVIFLVLFGIVTYKKYFDEKRQQEIGEIIHNAFASHKTYMEEAEENLSVMDKMSFSQNGDVLFISIYNIDDELKLEELADSVENAKNERWFSWNYIVVDIFHYKLGMVASIEINVDTMETRNYSWYDEGM